MKCMLLEMLFKRRPVVNLYEPEGDWGPGVREAYTDACKNLYGV